MSKNKKPELKKVSLQKLKDKLRRRRLGICIDDNTHPTIIQILQLAEEIKPGNKKAEVSILNAIKECPTNEYNNVCEAIRIKYGFKSIHYNLIDAQINKIRHVSVKDFARVMETATKTQHKKKKNVIAKNEPAVDQVVIIDESGKTRKRFQAVTTED